MKFCQNKYKKASYFLQLGMLVSGYKLSRRSEHVHEAI